jgi:gamma-aminobutyric acid receptor subunit beta
LINDIHQTLSIDTFIGAQWQDRRLALPEAERKGQKRFLMLENIWTPRILFLNNRGLTSHLREGVEVDDLGNIKYLNRLTGTVSIDLDFSEFPFDVQRLPIDIISYEYTTDEMQFSLREGVVMTPEAFSIEGWQIKQLDGQVNAFTSPDTGEELPRLTYLIEAKRDSDYYLLTMLVPMSLIIFMAWTVFWLQPEMVAPRIGISTASIFSLIALGVSIRLGLPKISYITHADVFVLGCTLMVFLALGVAVLGSRWANSDRMHLALKANSIARWVYMFLFIGTVLFAFYR